LLRLPPMGSPLLDVASLAPGPRPSAAAWRLMLRGNAWFNLYLVGAGPLDLAGPLSLMPVKSPLGAAVGHVLRVGLRSPRGDHPPAGCRGPSAPRIPRCDPLRQRWRAPGHADGRPAAGDPGLGRSRARCDEHAGTGHGRPGCAV